MEYNDRDIDVLTRTILGEAASESDAGQTAVAHVIRNRAADPRWPDTLSEVALQRKQFSAWNEGVGGNTLTDKYNPGDPQYERAKANAIRALSSNEDITGGATHYYSPAGMKAHKDRGEQQNTVPKWLQQEASRRDGNNVTLGGHVFTGLRQGAEKPLTETYYDPDGQPAVPPVSDGIPQMQDEPDYSIVPPITGNEMIDGTIDNAAGALLSTGVNALLGGSRSAPTTPAPPPPPPMMNIQGSGPVIFKIKRKKETK